MTVLINRAEQTYAPGTYPITRTIPTGATVNRIRITLSDPGTWPAGIVGSARLAGPNGPAGEFPDIPGGQLTDRQGNIRTARIAEFKQSTVFDDGTMKPAPFPAGAYTLTFEVLQPVTTALTVEWF